MLPDFFLSGGGMYSVDTFVLSFFIYCVLGWICEVVYCSVPKKRFVNRGFLIGPYLPIYGFGAMIVIVVLYPFREHWYLVFICGVVLTSVLEYFTSFALEKLFHVKLWDYSTYPLNINGRVCALNSTLFGLLCLFIVYVVNDPIYNFLAGLNMTLVNVLSLVIVGLMSADTAVSVSKMSKFQEFVKEINVAKANAEASLKALKSTLSPESFAQAKERFALELEGRKKRYYSYGKRIFESNPSLTLRDGAEQLEKARALVNELKEEYKARKAGHKAEKKARKERKNNG